MTPGAVLLRGGGVSVVIALDGPVPRIVHWGADVGELDDAALGAMAAWDTIGRADAEPDVPRRLTLWATERDGWSGTQTLSGHAAGAATTPRPRLVASEASHEPAGGGRARLVLDDEVAGLREHVTLTLDAHGVLAVDQRVERPDDAAAPYVLAGLTALMPLPERASELLDFTGRWCRERAPQRSAIGFGTHLRRSHRGRPGHDSPYLLMAGTDGFGFRSGEVWAVHLAWSGEQTYLAERLPEGAGAHSAVLGAGEALAPGEVALAPGDEYRAPTVVFVWSDVGMDGVAARLHDRLRGRPQHPRRPRPLTLNTWEAVYFDHDIATLTRLIERGATVGVERLVLDDGWFLGRRDDTAGLGDWAVDPAVWPDGLAPLVDAARAHGMEFGLWFEPEMINQDSELARAHPEWILGPSCGLGPSARDQHVLDVSHPEAWRLLRDRIDALVREYGVSYIKWDHNRDLLEAVARRDGVDRPIVHEQTTALYRLIDELRRRNPGLEIESCSSGGGRIDLGILERTDRVWASDSNDPVERGRIERWTGLLLPPELVGSHVGPPESHTTGRVTDLGYRLATSLTGHAGIEWDLLECTTEEVDTLAAWAALHKQLRPLLHGGRVVHADLVDPGAALDGVVSPGGDHALYRWSRIDSAPNTRTGATTLPGIADAGRYRVRIREEAGAARTMSRADPPWVAMARAAEGVVLPAAMLTTVGLPMPALAPQQAMLIEVARPS